MYSRLQHGYHAAVNCLDLCSVAFAFENCNAFHTFKVPRFPVPRFQRFYMHSCRAFAIAGPSAWNSLPDPVANPNCTEAAFRGLLKTFLFARY